MPAFKFCCFAIAISAGTGYDALRVATLRKSPRFFMPLVGGIKLLFVLLMLTPYPALIEDLVRFFNSWRFTPEKNVVI